jgi:hypothetical protein
MPYHVNNVDMTVASNFLFGTSQAVLEGLNGGSARTYFVQNANFQQVYENTAQLVRSEPGSCHPALSSSQSKLITDNIGHISVTQLGD